MALPSHLRDPLDFQTANAVLQESVLNAFGSIKPVEYGDYRLEVSDAHLSGPTEFSKKQQKQAILQRGEVSIPVKGTLRLIDRLTDTPVAERRTTLMRLPWLTQRGTYVRPGGEYTLAFQKRLRPGVYTRKTNSGEFESFVKTKSGTGFNFVMDPESGELDFKLYNSKTPAYAAMRAIGMDDEEIRETLGDDLFKTNYRDNYRNALPKLWQKLTHGRRETDDPGRDLASVFEELELDEETTAKTLGQPYRNVNKDVFRAAVGNLLKTYRGEREPDNRDSFSFQQIMGPEDYFSEGILRDKAGTLRGILYKAQTTKNLDHVHANVFRPVTDFVFNSSRLALTPETPNPMDALDGNLKITGMGEGGFTSNEGVPDSSRLLTETQLGTIDLVRSPESGSVGIDSRLALKAYKGRDGKLYTRFYDVNGDEQYLPSSDIDQHVIAFPGELEKVADGRQSQVRVVKGGQLDYASPEEVQYILPSGQQMFSLASNLIPFISGVKGMRAMMGCIAPWEHIEVRRADKTVFEGPIGDYQWVAGDRIESMDDNGTITWEPIRTRVPNFDAIRLYTVVLRGGFDLTTTANHKWVTLDALSQPMQVRADQLRPGNLVPLRKETGVKWVPVERISSVDNEGITTFDLDLDDKTFVVNNIVVHNSKYSVTADTQILIRRGDDSVYLGPVGSYVWQDGDMSVSLDRKTTRVKWLPVRAASSHEHDCKIFEIRTSEGKTVRATDHHSFVRLERRGYHFELVDIRTEDLRVGDLLPTIPFVELPEHLGYAKLVLLGEALVVDEGVAETLGTVVGRLRISNPRCATTRIRWWEKAFGYFGLDYRDAADLDLLEAGVPDILSAVLNSRKSVRKAFVSGFIRGGRLTWGVRAISASVEEAERLAVITTSVGRGSSIVHGDDGMASVWVRRPVTHYFGHPTTSKKWRKSGLSFERLVSIKEVDAKPYARVYDLHMDDNLFWCSSGLLVHNTNQSVSLPSREAPWVQTVDEDGKSIHRVAGEKAGSIFAKQGGRVLSATPEELLVEYDDGVREHIELYDNHPLNRKSQLTQKPIVEVGQHFEADQPIVDSNYTKNGVLALGTHLRVAYMGQKGRTHEDAQVISESAAKKLSSHHMYTEKLDLDDTTSTDLGKFMSIFAGTYKKAQLDNIGDDGVVLPGTVVHRDDPLIINMKRKTNKGSGMLGGGKASLWKDNTITWQHDTPGVVTDVWNDKSGMKIAVAAEVPMKVGDKMCFTPGHQVYTVNRGWVDVTEIGVRDVCMTLDLTTLRVGESRVSAVSGYPIDENIVVIRHPDIQTAVTTNHRIPASLDGMHFELYAVKELLGVEDFWVLAGSAMMPVLISVEEHLSFEPHSGWVFCPTLESTHTLLVKYERTIHWSGNSNIYGGKGIVGSILKDAMMPRGADGRPLDALLNPYGVVGRHNPSQIAEALLAKVSEKTGKSYLVPAFMEEDIMEYVAAELEKHGVSPEEEITLPEGRVVGGILTGNAYLMRLHHHAEDKESEVGEGAYSMTGVPTTEEGGDKPKRMGTLETDALISHGATEVLKDVKMVRGQENRDYFKDLMEGKNPPIPKVSPMYRKFIATLQAAGIRVSPDERGESLQLKALTDADVEKMSAGEVGSGDTVKWKSKYSRDLRGDADLAPVDGGLFDRGLTGGMGGNRWTHISLPAKLPNPVFEKQIRTMLGLTEKGLLDIVSGREKISGFGSGPRALEAALNHIDVEKQLESLSAQYRLTDKPSVKDRLAKQIRAYKGIKNMGLQPRDLLVSKVAVIPPVFRPVSITPDFEIISDANMLYKDLLDAGDNYKALQGVVDEQMSGEALESVYRAHKALVGLADPVKRERIEKNVKGLLKDVFGPGGNKTGIVQRSLLGTPTSFSSRGVIVPDYNLTMDEIGVPEEMAWTIFKPFVVRRMIAGTTGSPDEKKKVLMDVENQRANARDALLKEMKERPVMYSRAPVLHKYGLLAGYAVPMPGHAIRTNVPVMAGLNADFDGDTLQVHALITKEAVEEAKEKMLPSRKLFSVSDFKLLHKPGHEFNMGLHLLGDTRKPGRMVTERVFNGIEALRKAYERGEVDLNDEVVVKDDDTER